MLIILSQAIFSVPKRSVLRYQIKRDGRCNIALKTSQVPKSTSSTRHVQLRFESDGMSKDGCITKSNYYAPSKVPDSFLPD